MIYILQELFKQFSFCVFAQTQEYVFSKLINAFENTRNASIF